MSLTTFNSAPYSDDFNEDNKFYRILFRPSFAVQARELTQLQTILQNQIRYHGDHVFKEGAMVIPGQISIDTDFHYIKLQPLYNGNVIETYINNLKGATIRGTSGLEAEVLHIENSTDAEPTTIYVRYTNSASDKVTKVFADNEVLTPVGSPSFAVQAITSDATGIGSAVQIQRGVYYVKGNFVLCEAQTLVLDKYTNNPSYRVGLRVIEKVITPEDDGYEMLLDNAQDSYNFAAPGAHRYYIDLVLSKLDVDSEDDTDFVELLQVKNGNTNKEVRATDYSVIEETLARRTFDESGNYTVRPFKIDIREHRDNNRGEWKANTEYRIGDVVIGANGFYVARNSGTSVNVAPVHNSGTAYDGPGASGIQWEFTLNPRMNRGIFKPEEGGDESMLAIGMEPGKAYVQGYEIEKISTEYVPVKKARDFNYAENAFIRGRVGNYVLIRNLVGLPDVNTFEKIDIYDNYFGAGSTVSGTKIGTARVRGIEWHSGTLPGASSDISTSTYKLFLFDIKLDAGKSFSADAKSFHRPAVAGRSQFLCTIDPVLIQLTGSVSSTGTTVTGNGTSFQTDLRVGDIIDMDGEIRRVTAINGQQSLTIDKAATVENVPAFVLYTEIEESQNEALLFPFPQSYIRSMRTREGVNDTSYTVSEQASGTTSSESGGICTLVISTTAGTFASSADNDNYLVVRDSDGLVVEPLSIVASGTSVTMTFDAEHAVQSFTVIGTVNKSGALGTEKTKTLTRGTVTFQTAEEAQAAVLSLGKADIYIIKSVLMADSFNSTNYITDISDRYAFDNGQRSTHYDIGKLELLPSFTAPSGSVQVEFEYFTHSTGDYFSVNSYPSGVQYTQIPYFGNIPLRDVLDFRPRIADNGKSFTESGSSRARVLKRGVDILADFSYYLPRRDKIVIDFSGNYYNLEGISSLDPKYPADLSLGMTLYELTIEPYTFSSHGVSYEMLDNKRYTMRDIGKLEKRIGNLEYYTSLSLLEQETATATIRDENGLDRFKNGFIVDAFTGHNVGNVQDADYLCAIDMEAGELRPFCNMDNVNLVESASNDTQRLASNYQAHGPIITLPVVNHVKLAEQKYASRIENIHPFAMFTFLGTLAITPASDEWFEVDRAPDIIKNVEGNYNALLNSGKIGTVWNAWRTTWSGSSSTSSTDSVVIQNTSNAQAAFNSFNQKHGAGNITSGLIVDQVNQGGLGAISVGVRSVTTRTTTTRKRQTRTGIKTSIVEKIDYQQIDDRVIASAFLPYCRERHVLVQARGLKPNTRFNLFFDGVDLTKFAISSSYLTYTPTSDKKFDTSTNAGAQTSESARSIEIGSYFNTDENLVESVGHGFGELRGKSVDETKSTSSVCLCVGDVIEGATSKATAVVVGEDFNWDTEERRLHIQNLEGTFIVGETIVGSLSGATGIYQGMQYVYNAESNAAASKYIDVDGITRNSNDFMVTNHNGELSFVFLIPNRPDNYVGPSAGLRFRTGVKEVKLIDVGTVDGNFTSQARGNYSAQGALETREATILATRNGELVQEPVTANRVVVSTSSRVVNDTGWYDPIAQTFLVDSEGGCMVTHVDIFFATKDNNVPVQLQIRECVNGCPGKKILPFSHVVKKPEDVLLSENMVTMPDGRSLPSYDTPTRFEFEAPVYLMHNTEYCIVLLANTDKYNVWISQMGDKIPASNRTISEQPYMGVFFKSQNASTWTADQLQDLKFTLWRAEFDTNDIANVEFVNDKVTFSKLEQDPVETVKGQQKIRIWHPNHGMTAGSQVVLRSDDPKDTFGVRGTGTVSSATNSRNVSGVGVDFNLLEKGSVIFNSTGEYVGIVEDVTSNTTLVLASNAVVAMSNSEWSYTMPIGGIPSTIFFATHVVGDVDPGSYTIVMPVAATKSGYFGGRYIRASKNVLFDVAQPYVQMQEFPDTSVDVHIKTTSGASADGTQLPYFMDSGFIPVVPNENNEFNVPRLIASPVNETSFLGGAKSFTMSVGLRTDNPALSPILDTDRISVTVASNLVNNATEVNTNVPELDIKDVHTGTGLTFTAPNQIVVANEHLTKFMSISIGRYIIITGNSAANNNGTYLVENAVLNNDQLVLTLRAANFTNANSIAATKIQVKTRFVDDIAPFGATNISNYVSQQIVFANPSTSLHVVFAANIPSSANVKVFYKVLPVGSSENLADLPYKEIDNGRLLPKTEDDSVFYDVDFEVEDIESFTAVMVKLVMNSTNTSQVPRIRDLRITACA